jgi:hypothetical protein
MKWRVLGKTAPFHLLLKKKPQNDVVWNDIVGSFSSPRRAEAGEEELCSLASAPLPLSPKT